ncbi:hypothetical protein QYE76_008136 [Lolium multiflorum]|uniref:F-box domain-containing protein n=1 Tax=Lolium multiflorum TaxID=4521 RepID=A0AAD8QGW3_LOLMU|nr:hypothetical protein QYE76_008136 [Lolium multiflorum]
MRVHLDLNALPDEAGQDTNDVKFDVAVAGAGEAGSQIDLNVELRLAIGCFTGEPSRQAVSLLLPPAGVKEEQPTVESRTCRGARNKIDGMPKKKAAASIAVDRISQLPDELLHHVLASLPVDEVVQTSVLARRWRHLWKRMPVLRLVHPRQFAGAVDYDRFVNHVIALRGDAPLVNCEIESHLTRDDYAGEPDEPDPNPYFDSWIQYALSCKVQVLRVVGDHVGGETQLALPFISQHLVKLDVQHFFVDPDVLDFSSCPVLEDLKMQEAGFWVRKMSFPSLKHMCISECNFPPDYRVCISAPCLVSLQLLDCQGKTPLLESMPLLETSSIDLSTGCEDKCGGCADQTCEGCRGYPVGGYQSVLLNSLSNAVNLELRDQPKVYIYKRDLESYPTFGRLKTLLLDMWCRAIDLHALVRILQHSPALEKLTLQLRSDERFLCAARGERKHVKIEESFACVHLKEVSIECEERLRVKDKVNQIVKIFNRSGVLSEHISFKKIPRPKAYCIRAVSPSFFDPNWSGED